MEIDNCFEDIIDLVGFELPDLADPFEDVGDGLAGLVLPILEDFDKIAGVSHISNI